MKTESVKSIKDGTAHMALVLDKNELSAVECAVANTIGALCFELDQNRKSHDRTVVKLALMYRINNKIQMLQNNGEMVL